MKEQEMIVTCGSEGTSQMYGTMWLAIKWVPSTEGKQIM